MSISRRIIAGSIGALVALVLIGGLFFNILQRNQPGTHTASSTSTPIATTTLTAAQAWGANYATHLPQSTFLPSDIAPDGTFLVGCSGTTGSAIFVDILMTATGLLQHIPVVTPSCGAPITDGTYVVWNYAAQNSTNLDQLAMLDLRTKQSRTLTFAIPSYMQGAALNATPIALHQGILYYDVQGTSPSAYPYYDSEFFGSIDLQTFIPATLLMNVEVVLSNHFNNYPTMQSFSWPYILYQPLDGSHDNLIHPEHRKGCVHRQAKG